MFIRVLLLSVVGLVSLPAYASDVGQFDEKKALAFSQAVLGKPVGNHVLTRSDGSKANLSDYRGKPLVISMIYTSCYHICPTTTRHLAKVVKKARAVLGADSFSVLTIGFDVHNDTPEAMRIFSAQQRVGLSGWDFVSVDAETIAVLSKDLGFIYFESANGFDHLIQSTVIDGNGVIKSQVYDMTFDTPLLVEPLKALVFGNADEVRLFAHIGNQIRLFCTVYDPANDRYYVDYSIFIGMFIGLTTLGLVIYFVVREWRRSNGRVS